MVKSRPKFLFFTLVFSLFGLWFSVAQQGVVEINQSFEIERLLQLKKEVNASELNYKIQIYSGNRSGAEEARLNFRKSFSDWSTRMEYETPNYKIWIGNFKTRLEADRALIRVKRKFNNAFIFKPKQKKK